MNSWPGREGPSNNEGADGRQGPPAVGGLPPAIQQVGLLADGTGRVTVTVWTASDQPVVREGERVRISGAAKNWDNGRVSVAVTGWSRIEIH